jgi:hypothetical protein
MSEGDEKGTAEALEGFAERLRVCEASIDALEQAERARPSMAVVVDPLEKRLAALETQGRGDEFAAMVGRKHGQLADRIAALQDRITALEGSVEIAAKVVDRLGVMEARWEHVDEVQRANHEGALGFQRVIVARIEQSAPGGGNMGPGDGDVAPGTWRGGPGGSVLWRASATDGNAEPWRRDCAAEADDSGRR